MQKLRKEIKKFKKIKVPDVSMFMSNKIPSVLRKNYTNAHGTLPTPNSHTTEKCYNAVSPETLLFMLKCYIPLMLSL